MAVVGLCECDLQSSSLTLSLQAKEAQSDEGNAAQLGSDSRIGSLGLLLLGQSKRHRVLGKR